MEYLELHRMFAIIVPMSLSASWIMTILACIMFFKKLHIDVVADAYFCWSITCFCYAIIFTYMFFRMLGT